MATQRLGRTHPLTPTTRRLKHHVHADNPFFGTFSRNAQCPAGEEGSRKEVGVVSKPKGRRRQVRKDKETARKVSELLTALARLIRAVSVLVDTLGKWFG